MSACMHAVTECGETCTCTCDHCQELYEVNWQKITAHKNLCEGCGMPKEMTLESLKEMRHLHFFQPCDDCKPLFKEIMTKNHLCAQCQGPLSGAICIECFCTEEVETCKCRQCVAARKSASDKTQVKTCTVVE